MSTDADAEAHTRAKADSGGGSLSRRAVAPSHGGLMSPPGRVIPRASGRAKQRGGMWVQVPPGAGRGKSGPVVSPNMGTDPASGRGLRFAREWRFKSAPHRAREIRVAW